jgi:hypothetical protein
VHPELLAQDVEERGVVVGDLLGPPVEDEGDRSRHGTRH